MKTASRRIASAEQRGMGLVELMIGIALGLVLLIALGYFLLGSRQANRTHDDLSRMQESGRQALEILGTAIRQAGYKADADAAFAGVALLGTNSTPDTITIQYDAQQDGEADCTGANVAAGALVTYAFTVNGSRELTCNGTAVADNIEDMQIVYGLDSNGDGIIESYQEAGGVADFGQVAAVRVNLLVRGPSTHAATGNQTYTFNGAGVTKTDGFLRQVFSATFTVRNQAG
jgi:type IV pilus assembly protein PilW